MGKGYNFPASAEWPSYDDHVTIALSVLNEKTGRAEAKVIDPHLTVPPRVLSFQEWKELQDCDSAVMLSGPLGKLEDIVVEDGCLRPQDQEKLTTLILENAPDLAPGHPGVMTPDELRTALTRIDRQTGNKIAAAMLNINPEQYPETASDPRCRAGQNFKQFADLAARTNYDSRHTADMSSSGNDVTADWTELSAEEQKELTDKWVAELEPLASTEKNWRDNFLTPENTPVPSAALRPSKYVMT
jgi:hypothetical protein